MKSFLTIFALLFLISCDMKKPLVLLKSKPIAMVKVGDTIYHCEKVKQVECGMDMICSNKEMYCMNNVIIEWL